MAALTDAQEKLQKKVDEAALPRLPAGTHGRHDTTQRQARARSGRPRQDKADETRHDTARRDAIRRQHQHGDTTAKLADGGRTAKEMSGSVQDLGLEHTPPSLREEFAEVLSLRTEEGTAEGYLGAKTPCFRPGTAAGAAYVGVRAVAPWSEEDVGRAAQAAL
eukprot:gene1325-6749_t